MKNHIASASPGRTPAILLFSALTLLSQVGMGATVGVFTGGDAGEGIDFSGNIIHAVNLAAEGNNVAASDYVISGVTFRDDYGGANLISGVTVGHDAINNWDAMPYYGTTTNDMNLAEIMWDVAHGAASGARYPTVTFSNLLPNQLYSLQALVSENSSAPSRAGSYALYAGVNEGGVLQDSVVNVDVRTLMTYSGATPTSGVVITLTGFTDASGNLFFHVPDGTLAGSDPNGVVQAVILTQVPETSSMALCLLGAVAFFTRRRA